MDIGEYNRQLRKAALRQWLNTESKLLEAIEELTSVAIERGYLKSSLAENFSMSCKLDSSNHNILIEYMCCILLKELVNSEY